MNVELRITATVTVSSPPDKSLQKYPAPKKRANVWRKVLPVFAPVIEKGEVKLVRIK